MENSFSLFDQKIAIVGAGKFAWSLGYALKTNDFKLEAIYSKSVESAGNLAEHLQIHKFDAVDKSVTLNTNVWLLTVNDSSIEHVSNYFAERFPVLSGHLFIHFSGGKTVHALEALRKKGAMTASMHIMQTFSARTPIELSGNYAVIESESDDVKEALSEFCLDLGLSPFTLTSFEKIFYHLGGVFSSNFMNANFAMAELCDNQIKSDIHKFNELLNPIAQQTLGNIRDKGVSGSLSGPIQRSDKIVIDEHLKVLKVLAKKDYKYTLLLMAYITQSLILLETKSDKQKKDEEIKDILKYELNMITSSSAFL